MRRTYGPSAVLVALMVALPVTVCALAARMPGLVASHAVTAVVTERDTFARLIAQSRDLGPVVSTRKVSLLLALRDPLAARRAADLAALYTPHSRMFGHVLTPARYEAAYGPRPATVTRVSAVLRQAGLATWWRRGNAWLIVAGPVRRIEATFGVRVRQYVALDGVRFYASAHDPVVPAALRPVVSGAAHLSSYLHPRTLARPRDVPAGGLTPDGLLTVYDVSPLRQLGLDGAGETVAFFEFDGFSQRDLDTFTTRYHLPPMHPTIKAGPIFQPGIETEMDLEVVHAIAPAARLVIYNFDWDRAARTATSGQDLYNKMMPLQDQMLSENPGAVISQSWGLCDTDVGPTLARVYESSYQKAIALGEPVFASTGDDGAFSCLAYQPRGTPPAQAYLGAEFPAAASGVTAVGGTRVSVRTDGSWYDEYVWEDNAETTGGGGGLSAYVTMPSWQQGPGVRNVYSTGKREVPDVSADADTASGVSIYAPAGTTAGAPSRWFAGGGTSQAAPIWAGMTALIDQYLKRQGIANGARFLNPALYALAAHAQPYAPFHDITVGTNLYYPATPGYDLATGLGTPDAWNLARDLESYIKAGQH